MFRPFIFAAALGLAACAAPAANPVMQMPALSADLSCNAGDVRQCPAGGCSASEPGEASTLYISLQVPARGGSGQFCIATGCEGATFTPEATNSGFDFTMRTSDRTQYASRLRIASDERSFTFSEANDGGMSTWTGECSVAGS